MRRLDPIRSTDGFVIPTAIIVLFVITLIGLAILATADVQTRQTGHESSGEAAFDLAESALDAQADQLKVSWPSASPGWTVCTQSSTPSTGCPGTALTSNLSPTYAGVSFSRSTWKTQIVDDTSPLGAAYYDDTLAGTAPSYDSNGDNVLWVRSQATINGQTRAVVAQMTRQVQTVALPHNVVTAGSVYTSNNGNKVIIQSQDPSSGQSGPVALRCGDQNTQPSYQSGCAGWDPNQGQLNPASNYQTGYVDPNGGYSTLSPTTLQQIKDTAIANGTYYPTGTCPPAGASGVIYVENANCVYQTTTFNSASAPGALVFAAGTLEFNGNVNFYGIIYMANAQGSDPGQCNAGDTNGPVFEVHGTGTLYGAVFVDKCGSVDAGSSAYNIQFSSNAFSGLHSYATPGLAKNTFRILPSP
jgi:Tfp pilus assembly protein PilX